MHFLKYTCMLEQSCVMDLTQTIPQYAEVKTAHSASLCFCEIFDIRSM